MNEVWAAAALGFASGALMMSLVWFGNALRTARRGPVHTNVAYSKTPDGVRIDAVVAYVAHSGRGVQARSQPERVDEVGEERRLD